MDSRMLAAIELPLSAARDYAIVAAAFLPNSDERKWYEELMMARLRQAAINAKLIMEEAV